MSDFFIHPLGDLGTDLRRVAVSCLLAADYQVVRPRLGNALREREAGHQHVRPAERAVGEDDALVDTHHKRLPHDALALRRSHREHGDLSVLPRLCLDPQRRLQRIEVERIHLSGDTVALKRPGRLVNLNLRGARHLLYANEYLHLLASILKTSVDAVRQSLAETQDSAISRELACLGRKIDIDF